MLKTQLQTELQLPSVVVINRFLEAAGCDNQAIESPEIMGDAITLVQLAVPHWTDGKAISEAVQIALKQLAARTAQSAENVHGDEFEQMLFSIQAQTQEVSEAATYQQMSAKLQVAQEAGTNEAIQDQSLRYAFRTMMQNHPRVQNSRLVTEAKDFFYDQATGFHGASALASEINTALGKLKAEIKVLPSTENYSNGHQPSLNSYQESSPNALPPSSASSENNGKIKRTRKNQIESDS